MITARTTCEQPIIIFSHFNVILLEYSHFHATRSNTSLHRRHSKSGDDSDALMLVVDSFEVSSENVFMRYGTHFNFEERLTITRRKVNKWKKREKERVDAKRRH